MPVAIEDVLAWIRSGGISHVVAAYRGDWIYTACGSLICGNAENIDTGKPKRICSRCRRWLKVAEAVATPPG